MTFKPCPFCNGQKIRDGFIRDGRRVYCADCSASVTAFQPNASEEAARAWNCRPCENVNEQLQELLTHAQTFVIDGVTEAKSKVELYADYPTRLPRYLRELAEARKLYADITEALKGATP